MKLERLSGTKELERGSLYDCFGGVLAESKFAKNEHVMRARHTMPCPLPVVPRSDRYVAPDRSGESDRVVVPWNDRDGFVIAHYRLWRIYIQGCCCRIPNWAGQVR